jgi:Tol biopolymer transport system component
MITKSGVKLLDFGLAKAMTPPTEKGSLTSLPTQQGLTQEGTILGTFQYMAPEQLEGKDADARTDIFALGATLYEMATGKKAFSATSQASLIGAILHTDPPPISTALAMSPPALDRLVKTCLAKDPEDRWQSAGDVGKELKWIAESSGAGVAARPVVPRRGREHLAWILVALLAAGLAGLLASKRHPRSERAGAVHSYLLPPEKTTFRLTGDDGAPVTVSPDGKRIAFGASGRVWVQSLETGTVSVLPSKSGGKFPFWSPDSRAIGFFADGKLKTIDASGGPIQTICDAPNPRGGAWNLEGTIVFAPDIRTGLFRVPAFGGKPTPVTVLDSSKHTTHRWPDFLPDGRHFIYLAANHNEPKSADTGIYLASLDGKENRRLFASDGSATWAPGWILSVRESSLMARPFDDRRLALGGDAVRVADSVHLDSGVWRGVFSASRTGVLVYQASLAQVGSQMTWFDRSGKALDTFGERRPDYWPRLSPDGRRVAVAQGDPNGDLWVYEIGRGTRIRLTTNALIAGAPVWSPDGSQIAYVSQAALPKEFGFFIAPSNGSNAVRKVGNFPERIEPTDWSRDGRYILYGSGNLGSTDIWALPVADPSKAFPLVRSEWHEGSGQFSPDGRWVAYVSLESGRAEIYVTPFPSGGARWQVSTEGGNLPRWRGDGEELYYLSPDDEIMAASVGESRDRFEVNKVVALFRVGLSLWRTDQYPYDVTADGQRFLVATIGDAGSPRVSLVTNWTSALAK